MLFSLLQGEISQEDYTNYNNIKIINVNLPRRIYGFVFSYRNINIIIINKYLSERKKKETLIHEFAHIELNHIDKLILDFKIEGIEDEADKYVEYLIKSVKEEC